jgi:hypothetical protein
VLLLTLQTKLDVANLAGGPMLLDVLQFMVGVLKRIRPGPPAESAPASTSAPPPAPQLSQHDYNAVRLVTTLLHQMQQVRCSQACKPTAAAVAVLCQIHCVSVT